MLVRRHIAISKETFFQYFLVPESIEEMVPHTSICPEIFKACILIMIILNMD